ncbi:MAG: HmuY family protein [Flavobacteriaceae bacterium]
MNNTIKLFSLLVLLISFGSCTTDDDNTQSSLEVETNTVSNLYAPQQGGIDPNTGQPLPVSGEFIKFDFATGASTTSETDWDIAFRGSTIIVNGGESFGATDEPERTGDAAVYITSGTMASVQLVDTSLFIQDSTEGYAITTGSGNGWYTYNPSNNTIAPTPGKILVFKTRNGLYAKVEILSYYKDAPSEITPEIAANDSRHYTFNYVYQPNMGETSFE